MDGTRAPITTALPPKPKSPSSMPNRTKGRRVSHIARVTVAIATCPISSAMTRQLVRARRICRSPLEHLDVPARGSATHCLVCGARHLDVQRDRQGGRRFAAFPIILVTARARPRCPGRRRTRTNGRYRPCRAYTHLRAGHRPLSPRIRSTRNGTSRRIRSRAPERRNRFRRTAPSGAATVQPSTLIRLRRSTLRRNRSTSETTPCRSHGASAGSRTSSRARLPRAASPSRSTPSGAAKYVTESYP